MAASRSRGWRTGPVAASPGVAAAEQELEAIAGLRGGRVRLASFSTAGSTLVPLAIARFSRQHPAVELSLVEGEPEDAIPQLKSGELDVALSPSAIPRCPAPITRRCTRTWTSSTCSTTRCTWALPTDHPLARRRTTRLADLVGESWLQGDHNGLFRKMHIAACERAGSSRGSASRSTTTTRSRGWRAPGSRSPAGRRPVPGAGASGRLTRRCQQVRWSAAATRRSSSWL